ncbi:MAG: UDP-N-acetylmuramoyl-L-alanine--D-glutamate ligase [Eubacteriales bacterium]
MRLTGQKILVIGAGRSGIAASNFLSQKGAQVELTDIKNRQEFEADLEAFLNDGIKLTLGSYPSIDPGSYGMVVPSPGVPLKITPIVKAKELGIPVLGELELAFQFAGSPIIAITGTNGKTTTTTLTGEIFKAAGYRTLLAGNIGLPLIGEVEKYSSGDVIVAEVSSFQLETTVSFKPQVGVILNITPDHIDRHVDMEGYTAAKAKIFGNQTAQDYTVLNFDDPLTNNLASICPGSVIFFSRLHKLTRGVFVQDNWIVIRWDAESHPVLPVDELGIPGPHNLENAMAAAACCWVRGIGVDVLARVLREFKGVAHRLEFVSEIEGISYINDSKGTNPDATIKALQSYSDPIVLIAGGRNKGNDFNELSVSIREKARAVILIGESAGDIKHAVENQGGPEVYLAGDLPEAVRVASRTARQGDVVLLSPACASWDMFRNYEERGELFKKAVMGLKEVHRNEEDKRIT